jgi:hypothetical protein
VHFDSGAIKRNVIHLDVDDVVFLQCGEDLIQDTLLAPAVGTGVNRERVAELFG